MLRFKTLSLLSAALAFAIALLTSGLVGATAARAADIPTGSSTTAIGALKLPYDLRILGAGGQGTTSVTLVDGAVPALFTATVKSTFTEVGTIVVTINGRRVADLPARTGGVVSAKLTSSDVDKGIAIVGMYVMLGPQIDCFSDSTSTATLSKGVMYYEYPVTPPKTIGTFISPGLSELKVQISTKATDAEQQAALDAVAALTHRFPAPTVVSLTASDEVPSNDFLHRTVMVHQSGPASSSPSSASASPSAKATAATAAVAAVTASTTPASALSTAVRAGTASARSSQPAQSAGGGSLTIGPDGSLLLTGPADALAATAFALADPALSLFDGASLHNVVGTPDWSPAPAKVPLAALGTAPISMSGVGRMESTIAINQPAFGRSLSAVEIDLHGTISPLPEGGTGRVDYIWNGLLIDSVNMTSDTNVDTTLGIDADQLNRENSLTIAFSFVPPTGRCTPPPLAARMDIDTKRSLVKATFGESVSPGFARFPQVMGSQVLMALGTAGPFASKIQQAGRLMEALQSLTPEQLTASLVSAEDFEGSTSPGILTGAGTELIDTLGAPLNISNLIQVRDPAPRFTAAIPGPLALAQAFTSDTKDGSRDIVILGPIPADAGKPNYNA
ncbi:MAG: hypothetical protein WC005_01585, partial [Candidatus Nanopelagicales bacterium]